MLLGEFPDIRWLKDRINDQFRKGPNNVELPDAGWPSVTLNTSVTDVERRDIKGPFSMFLNLEGSSSVQADRRHLKVGTDRFVLTNFGQHYDLIIQDQLPTTTFNIHFGERLFVETCASLKKTYEQNLDQPAPSPEDSLTFFIRTRALTQPLMQQVQSLKKHYESVTGPDPSDEIETELLRELLQCLIMEASTDLKGADSISSLKHSTRIELLKRLYLTIDFMHDNYGEPLNLNNLSEIACLSKYHYLRTFKEVFGHTPLKYLKSIRLEKAKQLLRETRLPVREIAWKLGFEEPNSFIRLFTSKIHCSPLDFRNGI